MARHFITLGRPSGPYSLALRTIVCSPSAFPCSAAHGNVVVGINFGVMLAWVALSCITLPSLMMFTHVVEDRKEKLEKEKTSEGHDLRS